MAVTISLCLFVGLYLFFLNGERHRFPYKAGDIIHGWRVIESVEEGEGLKYRRSLIFNGEARVFVKYSYFTHPEYESDGLVIYFSTDDVNRLPPNAFDGGWYIALDENDNDFEKLKSIREGSYGTMELVVTSFVDKKTNTEDDSYTYEIHVSKIISVNEKGYGKPLGTLATDSDHMLYLKQRKQEAEFLSSN